MRPFLPIAICFFCATLGCATPPSDAPSQQNPNEPPPTHDANSNPDEGEGIGTCTEGQTHECCGDSVCDGPETSENCPTDCPVTTESEDDNPDASETVTNDEHDVNDTQPISEKNETPNALTDESKKPELTP